MPTFATRMQKYLGKPFREGATGPDAYDCVGFLYSYLSDSGKNVPATFQDWTLADYFALAHGPQAIEEEKLREWILTLGEEIPPGFKVAGDIVMAEFNGMKFICLYCGNGHAVSVNRKCGVRTIKIDERHVRTITVVRAK